MEGMRAFARSHRKAFDPATTFVLAIDSVGAGDIRWVASEGLTVPFEMDGRLQELCDAVALADREGEDRYRAEPLRHGYASDALAARVHGWRATTITCREPGASGPANHHARTDLPEAIDPVALDRAQDFALDLIRALDRDLARAAAPDRTELAPAGA